MTSPRTAILVLGCATEPYVQTIDTIRNSWGSLRVPDVDIFYVYGVPRDVDACLALSRWIGGEIPFVEDDGICRVDDVLLAGCADLIAEQDDCLLRKRLIAFEYLASAGRYDFIYTVCATSYVDQRELIRHASAQRGALIICGPASIHEWDQAPFVSGASMLLSADVALSLGRRRGEIIAGNRFGFRDDVTIGHWAAMHLSEVPPEEIMSDIRSGRPFPENCIFVSAPGTSVDYVMASLDELRPRPGAYHYHFHSRKAHYMAEFHRRHFAHQTAG